MSLRQKIVEEKDFIRKINRSKNSPAIKRIILGATPQQVRLLQNVIIAHFDPKQQVSNLITMPFAKTVFFRFPLTQMHSSG